MRPLLPLLAAVLLSPGPAVAAGPPCVPPALTAPDARNLSGDGYVRVAADGSASWLLPGVVGAAWHGTRPAYWTEPVRAGLPSVVCVDGAVRHAGVRTAYAQWSPDGTMVAVGDAGVLTIVSSSGTATAGAGTALAWSPAGDALAVAHDGVVTVRALDGAVTATLDSDRYASALTWAGDRIVYAASSGDGETDEVVSVRPDGTGRVALAAADSAPVAFSGSRIAYVGADGDVRTTAADGTAAVHLPVSALSLAFSPDAGTLAYAGPTGGTVAAAGTATTTVVAGGAFGTGWADGAWFRRAVTEDGPHDLYAGGASVAQAAPGHALSIVRRDADGSYVIAVTAVRAGSLPRVG